MEWGGKMVSPNWGLMGGNNALASLPSTASAGLPILTASSVIQWLTVSSFRRWESRPPTPVICFRTERTVLSAICFLIRASMSMAALERSWKESGA